MAAIPIGDGFPICHMGFPVGLLRSGSGPLKAKQSQKDKSTVKGGGVKVPPVSEGLHQGHGIHGPVKAELVRAEQEPGVGGRQVEER